MAVQGMNVEPGESWPSYARLNRGEEEFFESEA